MTRQTGIPYLVLKNGDVLLLQVQQDIPYLRSGDRHCMPFTLALPIVLPRPSPPSAPCVPSIVAEPPEVCDGDIQDDRGGEVVADDNEDDGCDGIPAEIDPIAQARSMEHLLTHRFKNPNCPSCVRCKVRQRPCRRILDRDTLDTWGRMVTCDHVDSRAPLTHWHWR